MEADQSKLNASADQISEDVTAEKSESHVHSFIVRIWLEESSDEDNLATWRGHITQVPSGERRHLENLEDIPAFIAPYLTAMGVNLDE